MLINKFREWVNLRLYNSKTAVLRTFDLLKIFCMIAGVSLVIYAIGFPLSTSEQLLQIALLNVLLGFYLINFLVGFLYTFQPGKYFRRSRLELFLLLLFLVQLLSTIFTDRSVLAIIAEDIFGLMDSTFFILCNLQVMVILLLMPDFAKLGMITSILKIDSVWIFILSFAVMICMGTILLMLPEMSNTSGGTSFLNAFFTSTSASCVTGLIIVDTAAYWTFKGQMVILILVQIGGVSILTFATFFATFVAKGVGAKQQSLLRDFFSSESISDARSILRNIIFISLAIELIGAVLIYLSFGNDVRFESTGHKIYQSIFHSVSAFNNSGFSIFTDGLYHTDLRSAYPFHFVIGILVFLGAIGFPFLQEYISWKRIRERQKIRWKRINIAARIAIGTAVGLTLITAILTFLLERNYALEGENFISQFCLVMFQAIDRTAGFSTMNAGDLRTPTLIIFCITMFIGSASGSTGGGIRTSTFAVLFLAGFSILRGKNKVEIFNNTLSQDLIYKSFTIFLFTVFFEMIMVFLLTITDAEHDLMAIIFEVVSAFATMGRSTGITPELSEIGKYLIILSMFVGRIGTITLIVALSSRSADAKYKYPSAQFMVG